MSGFVLFLLFFLTTASSETSHDWKHFIVNLKKSLQIREWSLFMAGGSEMVLSCLDIALSDQWNPPCHFQTPALNNDHSISETRQNKKELHWSLTPDQSGFSSNQQKESHLLFKQNIPTSNKQNVIEIHVIMMYLSFRPRVRLDITTQEQTWKEANTELACVMSWVVIIPKEGWTGLFRFFFFLENFLLYFICIFFFFGKVGVIPKEG